MAAENKLENKILDFLSKNGSNPSSALQVAKGVGLSTASEVNPVLYRLERDGRVQRKQSPNDSDKFPLWMIGDRSCHDNACE